jgi:hypothetical protein
MLFRLIVYVRGFFLGLTFMKYIINRFQRNLSTTKFDLFIVLCPIFSRICKIKPSPTKIYTTKFDLLILLYSSFYRICQIKPPLAILMETKRENVTSQLHIMNKS